MADKTEIQYYDEKEELGKWDFITLNWQKYCEEYKELWANAIINGYGLPILLDYSVPNEYDLTSQERVKINNKVSKENREKLTESSITIRKLETDHTNGELTDKDIKDFLLKELKDFLKAFPQYNDLIIKYNDDIINAI